MFPSPAPFPSDAVYETVKFHVLSYGGNGLAVDVGGVRSTITNVSMWLEAMSTVRGSFAKFSDP